MITRRAVLFACLLRKIDVRVGVRQQGTEGTKRQARASRG